MKYLTRDCQTHVSSGHEISKNLSAIQLLLGHFFSNIRRWNRLPVSILLADRNPAIPEVQKFSHIADDLNAPIHLHDGWIQAHSCMQGTQYLYANRRLEGKVAIITGGAATGTGRAAVRLLVVHGAFVLFGDIQDKLGAELAQELAPNASFLHCDVTQENDVAALVDAAVSTYGHLDIMHNNAGIAGPRNLCIQDLDMAFKDFVYTVNIRGAILGTKHAARVTIPAKTGVILTTASTASTLGGLEQVPHNISKLAMAGLIKSASAGLGQHGIRVNCISSPSTAWTPTSPISEHQEKIPGMTQAGVEDSTERSLRRYRRGIATKLLPEEVARAALFLASDDAKFISALNLYVDGDLVPGKLQ